MIDSSEPCDKNCDILCSAIKTGYDILMPEKHVKFHRNDNPWITEKLKQLIKFRQRAFSSNNITLFKFYRNKVNRMRKSCRADYFASKVANLKKSNPKSWWTEVKRISGMRPVSGSLLNQLHAVPFLTIYLGGAIAPLGKEFAPPVKPFLPPKCEAELLMIAVRIAVDLLDNEIMPFHSLLHSHLVCNSYCSSPSIS